MNVFSKLFNMISVLFILLSTVSFCIETLPAYDDSYVNEGGAKFENKNALVFKLVRILAWSIKIITVLITWSKLIYTIRSAEYFECFKSEFDVSFYTRKLRQNVVIIKFDFLDA